MVDDCLAIQTSSIYAASKTDHTWTLHSVGFLWNLKYVICIDHKKSKVVDHTGLGAALSSARAGRRGASEWRVQVWSAFDAAYMMFVPFARQSSTMPKFTFFQQFKYGCWRGSNFWKVKSRKAQTIDLMYIIQLYD